MTKTLSPLVPSLVDARIHVIRGRRVMFDSDLALLYGVTTKALKQAVKRNRERFPDDFMFLLKREEIANLRSQSVTSSPILPDDGADAGSVVHGGVRYLPMVFTQEGVAMLSGVLRTPRAVAVSIEIMRAFVRLRRLVFSVKELATKVDSLEKKYDGQFGAVFEAIRELMAGPAGPDDEGVIGFHGRPKKSAAT